MTVIFIEATGNSLYGLPLFLVTITARWVANSINTGMFETTMSLRNLPVLAWEPPIFYNRLCSADIMSKNLVVLHEVERAGNIVDKLSSNMHNGFPVVVEVTVHVDSKSGGKSGGLGNGSSSNSNHELKGKRLIGSILRKVFEFEFEFE